MKTTLAARRDRGRTREGGHTSAAQLIVLAGEEVGRVFVIDGAAVLGRGREIDVPLPGDEISRAHARITRDRYGVTTIQDLGSTNGTFVNGVRIERAQLDFGDRIGLGGETMLVFSRRDQIHDRMMHMQRVQALGQLASGVAHDFNNLLGAILANVTDLLEAGTVEGEAASAMAEIELAARRGAGITSQLLAFSRAKPLEPKHAKVSDLVDEARRMLRHLIPRTFSVDLLVDEDLEVVVDPQLVPQVLVNLCTNAADAMPGGGRISVIARETAVHRERRGPGGRLQPGRYAEIVVRDEGHGMDGQTLARIFDPFFTTKAGGKGTGLGLATAQRIVRDHGGAIEVESERRTGTTFRVFLPIAAAAREAAPGPTTAEIETDLQGCVLVVDDEEALRLACQRVLTRAGLEVLTASSGRMAIEMYQAHADQIDLVLMDVDMPGMRGPDAMLQIMSQDPDASVLICSGLVDETEVEMLGQAGALGVLLKPYTSQELRARVASELHELRTTVC